MYGDTRELKHRITHILIRPSSSLLSHNLWHISLPLSHLTSSRPIAYCCCCLIGGKSATHDTPKIIKADPDGEAQRNSSIRGGEPRYSGTAGLLVTSRCFIRPRDSLRLRIKSRTRRDQAKWEAGKGVPYYIGYDILTLFVTERLTAVSGWWKPSANLGLGHWPHVEDTKPYLLDAIRSPRQVNRKSTQPHSLHHPFKSGTCSFTLSTLRFSHRETLHIQPSDNMKFSTTIASASMAAIAIAVPTKVLKRADSCGQWDTVETGSYTVYNNLWGESSATSGSQCFGVDGLSGNKVSWHTT